MIHFLNNFRYIYYVLQLFAANQFLCPFDYLLHFNCLLHETLLLNHVKMRCLNIISRQMLGIFTDMHLQ